MFNTKINNLIRSYGIILIGFLLVGYTSRTSAQVSLIPVNEKNNFSLDQYLVNYEIFDLEISKSMNHFEDEVEISISSQSFGDLKIIAIKNSVVDDQSQLKLISEIGEIIYPTFPVRTYSGMVKGAIHSEVQLTLGEKFLAMNFKNGKKNYTIEVAKTFTQKIDHTQYVLYNVDDLKDSGNQLCRRPINHVDSNGLQDTYQKEKNKLEGAKSSLCKEMDMLVHVDYALLSRYDYDINAIAGAVATIFNLVNSDFEGISDNIDHLDLTYHLQDLIVSNCKDCDLWTPSIDMVSLLNNYIKYTQEELEPEFDLAALFSGLDFNSGIVGLSNIFSTCVAQSNNLLIKVNPEDSNLNRGRCTHEIGHALGCTHNYQFGTFCSDNLERRSFLMDPSINRNTDEWADGTLPCTKNSIQTLFNSILSAECLDACWNQPCEGITEFKTSMDSSNSISINWKGTANEYKINIRKEGDSDAIFQGRVSDQFFIYTGLIDYCAPYHISVTSVCNGKERNTRSKIVYSNNNINTEIVSVKVLSCTPGNPGTFDLEVSIKHQGGDLNGFDIFVNGQKRHFNFIGTANSIQILRLSEIISSSETTDEIVVSSSTANGLACADKWSIQVPNFSCDISEVEKFDFCELPTGWSKITTNTLPYADPFEWKFGNGDREILNFGNGSNHETSKTLNGSCMAYFDDDVNSSPNYSGNITLESKIFDFSDFDELTVKFIYNFHNFGSYKGQDNSSHFDFEVFDGDHWVKIYEDDQDKCDFTEVWTEPCITEISLNLTPYNNERLKVRFNYSDGNNGKWTGMIAIDEFEILGANSTVLPVVIKNFEARAEANKIELSWESFNEEAIAHYLIEKFDKISQEYDLFIKISADNLKYSKYQKFDVQPEGGENLYRLTPISQDNQKMKPRLANAMWEDESAFQITVFPNPVAIDYLHIDADHVTGAIEYILIDMNGQMIRKLDSDETSIKLRLDNVLPGIYLLQIKTKTETLYHRIIRL